MLSSQVQSTLGYILERLVNERVGMAILVHERHRVECRATRVARADADRQPGDVRIRPSGPPERVGGKLTPRTDDLAKGPPVHAHRPSGRRLDEPTFHDLDLHAGHPSRPTVLADT